MLSLEVMIQKAALLRFGSFSIEENHTEIGVYDE